MTSTFDPRTLIPSYLLGTEHDQIDGRVSGSSGVFDGGKYSYKAVQWTGAQTTGSCFEMSFQTGDFQPYQRHRRRRIQPKPKPLLIEEVPISLSAAKPRAETRDIVLYNETVDNSNADLRGSTEQGVSGRLQKKRSVETETANSRSYSSTRQHRRKWGNRNDRFRDHHIRRRKPIADH